MMLGAVSVLGLAAFLQVVPQAAEPCRVSGTVIDSASRAGVAGAQVVVRQGPKTHATVATDGEGRFEAGGLPRGGFTIAASTPGFAESPAIAVELTGTPCAATVEIPYRLAMQTESRASIPRLPDATPIASPAAPMLTGAQITASPGALEDLFRAFQAQPGVAASQDNRNDLLVRGGSAIENQIRIDGFDAPNPNHFGAQGGTGGGLSMIPPWLVDVATIETGGFSVGFGEKVSSVADISLRPARPGQTRGMAGFGVGGAMGELEHSLADDKGSWIVSARRSLLELTFHEQGDEVVPTYSDALVRVDRRIGVAHRLELLGIGGKDTVDVTDANGGSDTIKGSEWVGLAGIRFDSHWSNETSSTLVASVGTALLDGQSFNGTVVDGRDRGRDVDIRFRADVRRRKTPFGDLLFGAAVKRYTYDYDLLANGVWTPYSAAKQNIAAKNAETFTDASAYVESTFPLTRRGRVTAGVRLDHWGASGVTTGSPRIKADFLVGRSTRLVAYSGMYRQGIPYIWQASAEQNASLAPITSKQYGGGVDVDLGRAVHIGVEGFDKQSHNFPVDVLAPGHVLVNATSDFESPFVGTLIGGGNVHARGLDSILSLKLSRKLQAAVNYSHWLVDQEGLDNVWRRAENEILHQARLEAFYAPGAHWSAGMRWRYVSGKPYTPFDPKLSIKYGRAVYDQTRINALDYVPYHRLDARVDKTFVKGRTSAIIYVEVDNLYNRDNILLYQWNRTTKLPKPVYQWGRTYIGGVRIEF